MAVILNKVITIQVIDDSKKSDNGFDTTKWIDKYKLLASVNNLFGKEFWSAKAVQSEKTVEFTVRYSRVIENLNTDSSRIVFDDKVYDITFIDNVKYNGTWIKIKGKQSNEQY